MIELGQDGTQASQLHGSVNSTDSPISSQTISSLGAVFKKNQLYNLKSGNPIYNSNLSYGKDPYAHARAKASSLPWCE